MTDNNESFFGADEFLFAKTKKRHKDIPKRKPGKEYEPEFIDYEPYDEDREWASRNLAVQIKDTLSVLDKKTLKIGDQIFYMIDFAAKPSSVQTNQVLSRLEADVLAYLNKDHNRVLVSASNKKLDRLSRKEVPSYFQESIHLLRPLTPDEQIPSDLQQSDAWRGHRKMIIFRIMPNLERERHQQYVGTLIRYLEQRNNRIYENLTQEGAVITDTDFPTTQDLINNSTFIYKVHAVPQGIARKVRSRANKKKIKKKKAVTGVLSSIQFGSPISPEKLATVVIMDTGVSTIPQLEGFIVARSGHGFTNLDDESEENEGHGTPIAHLTVFGEDVPAISHARIISHKIWSSSQRNVSYQGMISGINRYSEKSRLFLTSISFENEIAKELISDLDKLAQRMNICFVCSAGNIPPQVILNHLSNGGHYASHLDQHPVSHPATAVSIIGVGAIAKKTSSTSIASVNSISPFSRCGSDNSFLFDCKKPEVVEHGGNLNIANGQVNTREVGVSSFDRFGNAVQHLVGTSFSSPLFVRRLAEIEAYYGTHIKNAETLKAIAIMSCRQIDSSCAGYGEPRTFVGCDRDHALYIAEGEIQLSDKTGTKYIKVYSDEIAGIKVPSGINRIDLCLVHTDNFQRAMIPSLNTYLSVQAWKRGSNSPVRPLNLDELDRKTNIKFLRYSFKRKSMESTWRFRITPETSNELRAIYRKEVTVRYGCAILLNRKPRHSFLYSVNEQIGMMD